jgi:hypothetical protein
MMDRFQVFFMAKYMRKKPLVSKTGFLSMKERGLL